MRDSAKEPDCLPYDLAFKVKLQNDFSSAGLGSFTIQNKRSVSAKKRFLGWNTTTA